MGLSESSDSTSAWPNHCLVHMMFSEAARSGQRGKFRGGGGKSPEGAKAAESDSETSSSSEDEDVSFYF